MSKKGKVLWKPLTLCGLNVSATVWSRATTLPTLNWLFPRTKLKSAVSMAVSKRNRKRRGTVRKSPIPLRD